MWHMRERRRKVDGSGAEQSAKRSAAIDEDTEAKLNGHGMRNRCSTIIA